METSNEARNSWEVRIYISCYSLEGIKLSLWLISSLISFGWVLGKAFVFEPRSEAETSDLESLWSLDP